LSGQFFLNAEDKQVTRGEACHNRLQSLNYYVKVTNIGSGPVPKDPALFEQEPWNFHLKDVIVLTESDYETIIAVNDYCHKKGIKFMAADAYGVYGRLFNDFGDKFEVFDKNGEEL
jgi:molybdopterin/thiamine biosynthesis adenylyltransferase